LKSVDAKLKVHVVRCTWSFEIWQILDTYFASQTKSKIKQLKFQLHNMKKQALISDYLIQIKVRVVPIVWKNWSQHIQLLALIWWESCWNRYNTDQTVVQAMLFAITNSNIVNDSWYSNKRATNHLIPDLANFCMRNYYNGMYRVEVGNNKSLIISHVKNFIFA